LCVACQYWGQGSKSTLCLCLENAPEAQSEQVRSSDSNDSPLKSLKEQTSIPANEAARLLRDQFQQADHPSCLDAGRGEQPPLARPWRPINPSVGASSLWRRRENVQWRLFWAARQKTLAEEEEAKLSSFAWPNTPSSCMEFDNYMFAEDELIDSQDCFPSQTSDFKPWGFGPPKPMQAGLHFSADNDLRSEVSRLAQENSMLHQRVEQLEKSHLPIFLQKSLELEELQAQARTREAEMLRLAEGNSELERRVAQLELAFLPNKKT